VAAGGRTRRRRLSDWLIRLLRPSSERPAAFWATAFGVPVLLWSCWFGAVAIAEGVGRSAELWTGTILWTALLGGALGLLMLPSRATVGSSASPGTSGP